MITLSFRLKQSWTYFHSNKTRIYRIKGKWVWMCALRKKQNTKSTEHPYKDHRRYSVPQRVCTQELGTV